MRINGRILPVGADGPETWWARMQNSLSFPIRRPLIIILLLIRVSHVKMKSKLPIQCSCIDVRWPLRRNYVPNIAYRKTPINVYAFLARPVLDLDNHWHAICELPKAECRRKQPRTSNSPSFPWPNQVNSLKARNQRFHPLKSADEGNAY